MEMEGDKKSYMFKILCRDEMFCQKIIICGKFVQLLTEDEGKMTGESANWLKLEEKLDEENFRNQLNNKCFNTDSNN